MGQAHGIIKLSQHQAEGRRSELTALCLKYIVCTVGAIFLFVLWMKNYGTSRDTAYIAGAAVVFLMSVYLRTNLHYRTYRLSERYLKRTDDLIQAAPSRIQLFGFGMTLLSVKCTVSALMLSPAALCLRFGFHSFALSGERGQLLLMLGASICLLLGGIIFAAVISAHFDCAEYLFFSGKCMSAFSAVENSWVIMCGCCGDSITLGACLVFRGILMSPLCRINLSEKLTRVYLDNRHEDALYCELRYTSLNTEYAAEFIH